MSIQRHGSFVWWAMADDVVFVFPKESERGRVGKDLHDHLKNFLVSIIWIVWLLPKTTKALESMC